MMTYNKHFPKVVKMTTSLFGEKYEVIEIYNYNLTQHAFERNGHGMLKGASDINQTKQDFVICIHAPMGGEGGFVNIRRFEGYLIVT
jgi:hypothetical protein